MAKEFIVPLCEKIDSKNIVQRALDTTILLLLLSLLVYRLFYFKTHGITFHWLLAFLCESWFTFNWGLIVNSKWNPVDYKSYPQNLQKRFPNLPNVDMFVTTADPSLEPPIITVNTVLSLLAVDYPAEKLACYVSDDGCSPLTFYSVVEASKFAKLWVPFCKKYNIQVRAPFRYYLGNFDDQPSNHDQANSEFLEDWLKMKAEYEVLTGKIEEAARKPVPCDLTGDFAVFSDVERSNHPPIIKIILENKEIHSDMVPNLVYLSREKRPKQPHNFKAGAMNVLARVSGVMTNAPFMLNVDCDMYVNNPQVVRHAVCHLLGSETDKRETAFVQYPQVFYDGSRDDPYGNQFVAAFHYVARGIAGLQGYFYAGTGCFHRRKVIYGLWPDYGDEAPNHTSINGKLDDEKELLKEFGNSEEFINSAAQALKGKQSTPSYNLSDSLEAAFEVASCSCEYGTSWGKKLGWIYGSTTEDVHTGLVIHNRGWSSALQTLQPPAFMGCAPSGGPEAMTQQKRWATGLLQVLIGENSPITATLTANLQFRFCLAYLWILVWALRSIPELCYAFLPAYCILTNSHFLPKVDDPAIWIPIAIFVIYNLHSLREYLKIGLSSKAWWNNLRMARITAISAYLFGLLSVILKLLGISETVFEVTQKDQSSDGDDKNLTKFTFNKSAIFIPGTTLLLVHLISLLALPLRLQQPVHGVGLGEVFCSLWVVLCFLPFLKGLFEKGQYGIPSSTIFKSAALATLFVHFCRS